MRATSIWAITCRCGWAPIDLPDTVMALACPECGTRLEIDWRPMERRAVGQDIRKWIKGTIC